MPSTSMLPPFDSREVPLDSREVAYQAEDDPNCASSMEGRSAFGLVPAREAVVAARGCVECVDCLEL